MDGTAAGGTAGVCVWMVHARRSRSSRRSGSDGGAVGIVFGMRVVIVMRCADHGHAGTTRYVSRHLGHVIVIPLRVFGGWEGVSRRYGNDARFLKKVENDFSFVVIVLVFSIGTFGGGSC